MNEKSTQILEIVKGLTILELADLVKALEEVFLSVCEFPLHSSSNNTACSLSHFSVCLAVSPSGGRTVFCCGFLRLPL